MRTAVRNACVAARHGRIDDRDLVTAVREIADATTRHVATTVADVLDRHGSDAARDLCRGVIAVRTASGLGQVPLAVLRSVDSRLPAATVDALVHQGCDTADVSATAATLLSDFDGSLTCRHVMDAAQRLVVAEPARRGRRTG